MRDFLPGMVLVLSLLVSPLLSGSSSAGDLDDKIGRYTDDDIQGDHEMGGFNTNITYKVMNALSASEVRENTKERKEGSAGDSQKSKSSSGSSSRGSSRDANMNSVVLGAGSNVRGDIIIIDQSRGDKLNVGGK